MAVRRVTISMPSELFDAIEDFRFDNRLPSFSAAIEELIRVGLEDAQRITRRSARLQRKRRERKSKT